MPSPKFLIPLAAAGLLAAAAAIWAGLYFAGLTPPPGQSGPPPPFKLSDRLASLTIAPPQPDGAPTHSIVIAADGQTTSLMDGEAFLAELARHQDAAAGRPILYRVLDITSPTGLVWVSIGLFGQLLFTGRMIIQWIASERARRSIVPAAFWWMSLAGSSMLIVYFTWRVELVGILGQATGWFIYVRNLWMLHSPRQPDHLG